MNEFISTFSFYGVLRIIIPGLYLFLGFDSIFLTFGLKYEIFSNNTFNAIAVSIFVIVIGLTIYSFDFPRLIRRLTPSLPTNQISKRYPAIRMGEIEKSYFRFYYSLGSDQKERTERYNGFYHLSINLSVVAIFLIIIQTIIFIFKATSIKLFHLNLSIFLLSIFNSLMIYKKRLIKTYRSDLMLYWSSDEFSKLKQENSL